MQLDIPLTNELLPFTHENILEKDEQSKPRFSLAGKIQSSFCSKDFKMLTFSLLSFPCPKAAKR